MLDMIKVTINEKEYLLRPSIKALRNIELALNTSIGEIGQLLSQGKVSLTLIIESIYFGLEAAGNSLTRDEIEQHLENEGFSSLNEGLVNFFVRGIQGKKPHGDEAQATS